MNWNRFAKKAAPASYNNKKEEEPCYYGYSHRSQLERGVCDKIREEELAGVTEHIAHEFTVYLTAARYRCIPDFKVRDVKTGEEYFREAKGYANPRWPTTKKLWKHYGPGRLQIFSGTRKRPVLIETITPKGNQDEVVRYEGTQTQESEA